MVGRNFVQNPGPTNIPEEVLSAFRQPAIDFDHPEFHQLVDGIWDDLLDLFGGAHEVICYTAVGNGAWEGAIVNLLEPGDTIVAPLAGRFSELWNEAAIDFEVTVETIEPDYRRAPRPEAVHDLLAADTEHKVKAVFLVHTETATSTSSDLAAMRKAIDDANHPALFVVDAIASFGTANTSMSEFGIDVLLTSSQKGMMMPPGLSFCALSERALEHSRTISRPRRYWSWPRRANREQIYFRFGGTPPEQHMYALRAAIDLFHAEGGLSAVAARHKRMATAVHVAVEGWATGGPWELNVIEPAERANALTCVRTGELDANEFRMTARDRFKVSVGGAMNDMAGHAVRIGHLGALNEPMLLGALAGLETTMSYLDLPHGPGVSAAAQWLGTTQRLENP